jgi:hypothetical protein
VLGLQLCTTMSGINFHSVIFFSSRICFYVIVYLFADILILFMHYFPGFIWLFISSLLAYWSSFR